MQNHDFFSRLITARILAGANGFTNTEVALAKLIDEHAKNLKAASPDWGLVSVADMPLKVDRREEALS